MPVSNDLAFYDLHVFLCTNERPEGHKRGSCSQRGAVAFKDYMKARAKELGLAGESQRFRFQAAGCLDRCELGPVLVLYPEGIWYGIHSTDDIDAILTEHVRDGVPVQRLILKREDRLPEDRHPDHNHGS